MREGIAMIKVDLSGAAGFFDPAGPDYAAAARAHRALLEHSGAGAEFTGWLDLPGRIQNGELKQILTAASRIRGRAQALEKEKPSSAWTLETWHDRFNAWFELMQKERMMMSFVLSFISLISAFCIMAVMFTVSIQRKKEIAVMKALGATPFQVVRVFLWQGVIIGFVGALLGVGLGLLVLEYRMQIQGFLAGIGFDPFPVAFHGTANIPVVIDWAELAWQAVKAFVMVVVASIIPALITARQDPARSLRSM